MKKSKKFVSLGLALCLGFSTLIFASCGGGTSSAGSGIEIKFCCSASAELKPYFIQAVKTYNEGQGKIDEVVVNASYSVPSSNLGTMISSQSASTPNVIAVSDNDFKGYAYLDYFLPLSDYLTSSAKSTIGWDNIPDSLKDRYCYNTTVDESINKRKVGKGQTPLALPLDSNPMVLYYRTDLLDALDINIISLSESELSGTNYMPHGYAEYLNAPATGLKQSKNKDGKDVYKVFNNKIAMNWEEFRYLANYIKTATSGCTYGYMSEYWFNYGWTVGGDCIGWDANQSEYVFTLNDKTANYLALADVSINGVNYKAGDVINYEAKNYIQEHTGDFNMNNFYELPSTYEAFLEFNRFGVDSDKTVDIDGLTPYKGYGLAKNTVGNNNANFKSTTNPSPFYLGLFTENNEFNNSVIAGKFNVAPQHQYREYEGGTLEDETVELNAQKLKVIGETYGGNVYTGELKKVNNVAIVGKNISASLNDGICIAKNSDPSKYEASFMFASWLAGEECQKILAQGNTFIPTHSTYALSNEYLGSDKRNCSNIWAASMMSKTSEIGDWAYFDEGSWVTDWADLLNGEVRKGNVTLSAFFSQKVTVANNALKNMGLKVYRSHL